MNKITIKGRLTADPELKKTNSDISVCTFSVAVNRRFQQDKADFINCEAWRATADFISKYFKKGQEILLTGELHIDSYEKDGIKRTSAKISVDEVEFCGSKSENLNAEKNEEAFEITNDDFSEVAADDLDLPF